MAKNKENIPVGRGNSGSTSNVPPEIWEQLKAIRNIRDPYTNRTPTREEIQEKILNEYGYKVSTKTIERRLPLLDLKFDYKKSYLLKKLSPHYYSKYQIDTFINIVKYSQSRLNEYVVKFIRLKLEFEINEQDKKFEERFPYDMIQNAWIDLYVGLEVIGDWLGSQKECEEIRALIIKYRPFHMRDPKEFGFDFDNEDFAKMGRIERFKFMLSGIRASLKLSTSKDWQDMLDRRNQYLEEAKKPVMELSLKLRNRAYSNSVQTPVSMMKDNELATWIEELIGRLPEPTQSKKAVIMMRNEIQGKREKKRKVEDYILWNILIKIFEQAESEVQNG